MSLIELRRRVLVDGPACGVYIWTQTGWVQQCDGRTVLLLPAPPRNAPPTTRRVSAPRTCWRALNRIHWSDDRVIGPGRTFVAIGYRLVDGVLEIEEEHSLSWSPVCDADGLLCECLYGFWVEQRPDYPRDAPLWLSIEDEHCRMLYFPSRHTNNIDRAPFG